MFNLEEEKQRLLERNPELKQETMSLFEESQQTPLLRFASVVDNRDPMCMGRLKVTFGPDDVSGWIQAIALGAAKGSGWWMLPDIGQQVVVSFVGMERQQPVVLGCIWSEVHRPPKPSSGEPRDAFLIQWGKHRVEFLAKDGNEIITISAANGKMRLEMSSSGGIKLINELGGIKIKCRKLKIIGREGVNITAKKSVTFKAKDMIIKAQDISMKSGGEMTFKAPNIQIEASRGITAEGKQMASSQSNVQGFDVHKMIIPSGSGTAVVPLPHPFIGKMHSELSPDVKLNGYQAATEGSVAKHNNEDHLQLPGTISFEQPPSRKGKVTGGTVESVKINRKPVAVVGSTVSTCNDIGTSDNSAIMAPGAHMPMPAIIHPKNTKEWKEGREAEKGELPEFMDVRAGAGSAKEGEQVKITALVKGIADGNQITFHVRPLGQPANTNIPPLAELRATVEGGAAETGYAHKHPKGKELPEGEPRLYAVAHSAWCPPKSGGEWEVVLLRPEIAEANCLGEGSEVISTMLVGEKVKLHVKMNKDAEEGAGVDFKVYNEGDNPKWNEPIAERHGVVRGGEAEVEWIYEYIHDPENPLTKKPEIFFTAESFRCKTVRSGLIEVGMEVDIPVCEQDGTCISELEYTLTGVDGTEEKGKTGKDGVIRSETLLPGNFHVSFNWETYHEPDGEAEKIELDGAGERYSIEKIAVANEEKVACKVGANYLFVIDLKGNNIS